MTHNEFYTTIWKRKAVHEGTLYDIGVVYDGEVCDVLCENFKNRVSDVLPVEGDGFSYVPVKDVILVLNEVFGISGWRFIEIERRIDSIAGGVDYHFVVRLALEVPAIGKRLVREGLESVSNAGIKSGARGACLTNTPDLGLVLDLSNEGMLSLWKNAEADAKKRCVVDMGLGIQFLADPAANSKKTNRRKPATPEPQAEPLVAKTTPELDRLDALVKLKTAMRGRLKIKDVYELCGQVLAKSCTSRQEFETLSVDDINRLTQAITSTSMES